MGGGPISVHVPASLRVLVDVYHYFERLEANGLFAWVEYLLSDPYVESQERARFLDAWQSARKAGCRPATAAEDASGVWSLVRMICDLPVIEAKADAEIADEFLAVRNAEETRHVQRE